MKTYLKAFDLWDIVETNKEPAPLRGNSTIAQIQEHSLQIAKKDKALTCIHSTISDVIFIRIMALRTPKAV